MEVLGRSPDRQAYRLRAALPGGSVTAWLPEALIAGDRQRAGGPSHEDAYAWIDRNRARIEAAMAALSRGARPRPPFDRLTLAEDSRCP